MTTGTFAYQLRKLIEKSEKCFVRYYQTTNSAFCQLNFDDFEGFLFYFNEWMCY
jgi:hypothetical protein